MKNSNAIDEVSGTEIQAMSGPQVLAQLDRAVEEVLDELFHSEPWMFMTATDSDPEEVRSLMCVIHRSVAQYSDRVNRALIAVLAQLPGTFQPEVIGALLYERALRFEDGDIARMMLGWAPPGDDDADARALNEEQLAAALEQKGGELLGLLEFLVRRP